MDALMQHVQTAVYTQLMPYCCLYTMCAMNTRANGSIHAIHSVLLLVCHVYHEYTCKRQYTRKTIITESAQR
jgi:hypothetical protein